MICHTSAILQRAVGDWVWTSLSLRSFLSTPARLESHHISGKQDWIGFHTLLRIGQLTVEIVWYFDFKYSSNQVCGQPTASVMITVAIYTQTLTATNRSTFVIKSLHNLNTYLYADDVDHSVAV